MFFLNIKISFVRLTGKKPALKTFNDIQTLLSQGKKRDVKLAIRENSWPINSTIRSQLWPALCSQHQVGKSMLDGFYWDMVNQVMLIGYRIIDFGIYNTILSIEGLWNNRTSRKTDHAATIC